MRPIDDTPLTRDGKALVLAYDHGIEHVFSYDGGFRTLGLSTLPRE